MLPDLGKLRVLPMGFEPMASRSTIQGRMCDACDRERLTREFATWVSNEFGLERCVVRRFAPGFAPEHLAVGIESTDGIWVVDTNDQRSALRDYANIFGDAANASIAHGQHAAQRLRSVADYLRIDWPWLARRARELATKTTGGMIRTRSHRMSTSEVDDVLTYIGSLAEDHKPVDPATSFWVSNHATLTSENHLCVPLS